MDNKLQKIKDHENKYWSKIFIDELSKSKSELFSHIWWKNYFESICEFVTNYCELSNTSKILEPGCGSGKASILLGKEYNRVLLDISPKALEYCQHLIDKFQTINTYTVEGDIFELSEYYSKFD